jgi:hypothetical protein
LKRPTIRFFNLKERAKRQKLDTVVILQSTHMSNHHFQIPHPEQAHGKIQLDFIVCLLADAGVTRWMVSPGSRNAPLVASMVKHGGFDLHSFPDERVAAFAALGAAQGSRYPVGVICTSGTAAANLYPWSSLPIGPQNSSISGMDKPSTKTTSFNHTPKAISTCLPSPQATTSQPPYYRSKPSYKQPSRKPYTPCPDRCTSTFR